MRLRKYREDAVLIVLIVVLAIAVFVFFRTFLGKDPITGGEPSNLTTEILAALLGSIITVMITMLLIKRQGSIEQAQESAVTSKTKVFEKKLELFREFISIYVQSAADGELDTEELQKLEELALTTSLFTKDEPVGSEQIDLGDELCRFVLQLEIFGLKTELLEEDFPVFDRHLCLEKSTGERKLISFARIARAMKIELGIAQSDSEELDESLWDRDEYLWTRRLLRYRSYRDAEPADSDSA